MNIDLIYGLPKQTLEGFAATLDAVAAMRPDRIAVHAYAHFPQMFRAQRHIDAAELPSPDTRTALLGPAISLHQGDPHRNFMGYTAHTETDFVGFGVSAISRIGNVYAQNHREPGPWAQAVDAGRLLVRAVASRFDRYLTRRGRLNRPVAALAGPGR